MSTKTKPKVITWDWKEQPDWDEVNFALCEQIDAFVHPVDSQSDQYVIVIGPREMTAQDAQERYEEWYRAGGEGE